MCDDCVDFKVYSAGVLLRSGSTSLVPAEAMGYVLSLSGVSTVIIGCSSPAEVDENANAARLFQPFDEPAMRAVEEKTRVHFGFFTSYKKPA